MKFLALLALLSASFIPFTSLFADDVSPVTGAVPDKIAIYADHRNPGYTTQGKSSLAIHFCDTHLILNYCASPARPLKISGNKTEGVKIDPVTDGEWRFSG